MLKQTFAIFAMLITPFLNAQQCHLKLEGSITDFHDGEPLIKAKIFNQNTGKSYFTDSKGTFSISNLCAGAYNFILSHPDCNSDTLRIKINQDKKVAWTLEHHLIQLESVEEQGTIAKKVESVPEEHLHEKDLEKYTTSTLGDAIKQLSGVSSLSTGNAIVKPMIHGLHSSRVIIYNNGVRQEDMEWGIEHSPNMDINAYNHISVIKGAGALRYGGDAIGGVVLTDYPDILRTKSFKGTASLNGIANGRGGSANLSLEKGFGKGWGVNLQGSYLRNGDFSAPNYVMSNTGVSQRAFRVEVGKNTFKDKFKISYSNFYKKMGIMTASHFGTLTDLAEAIASRKPITIHPFTYTILKPYQKILHHLAKVEWEHRFRDLGKVETNYAFQFNHRFEFDNRRGEVKKTPSMDTELKTHSVEAVLTLDHFKNLKIQTGVDGAYQNNYSNPQTRIKRLIPDYDKFSTGTFVALAYKKSHWAVNAGLRYDFSRMQVMKYYRKKFWAERDYDKEFHQHIIGDYSNEWLVNFNLNYNNYSGVLGATYHFNPHSNVSLVYSLANRAPNPSELFSEGLHHGASAIEIGDVRLKPETSHKINLGTRQRVDFLNGLDIDFNLYYNQINHFIYQIPKGLENTIRGAFQVVDYEQINANIAGFDLNTDLKINDKISYKNKLAYLYANDILHHVPLINMPPLQWDQEIKWQNKESEYQPYFSLSSHFTARQNRYPNYNIKYEVFYNNRPQKISLDVSTPPSAYFLMDLSAGIKTKWIGKEMDFNLYAKNLLNQSYRNYLDRYRFFSDEMGRQIQLQAIIKF